MPALRVAILPLNRNAQTVASCPSLPDMPISMRPALYIYPVVKLATLNDEKIAFLPLEACKGEHFVEGTYFCRCHIGCSLWMNTRIGIMLSRGPSFNYADSESEKGVMYGSKGNFSCNMLHLNAVANSNTL